MRPLLILVFLIGFARADAPKVSPVVARVVAFEVNGDATIVTIAAGKRQGLATSWRGHFREGKTQKLLAGGEAVIIRVDERTSVLKTTLTPAQVRANVHVQLSP